MSYFTEESIVDGCISDGRISKKNLSYLEKEFQEGFDAVAEAVSINIADGILVKSLIFQEVVTGFR